MACGLQVLVLTFALNRAAGGHPLVSWQIFDTFYWSNELVFETESVLVSLVTLRD